MGWRLHVLRVEQSGGQLIALTRSGGSGQAAVTRARRQRPGTFKWRLRLTSGPRHFFIY
jgi:hypothetical protein